MSAASDIRDAMRAARERLRDLGLPEDPAARWTGIDPTGDFHAQFALRWDASPLYDVIDFGERALAAQAAGDLDAFAAALETMVGAKIESRLPQIRQTLHRQRQRTSARKPRSSMKQTARQLYDEHHPASAKDLLKRLEDAKRIEEEGLEAAELAPTPKLSTVADWFTEFRRPKKKSV